MSPRRELVIEIRLKYFFIHIYAFKVEKMEESAHGAIFTSGIQFGKMGSETFRENFEASNDVIFVKKLLL